MGTGAPRGASAHGGGAFPEWPRGGGRVKTPPPPEGEKGGKVSAAENLGEAYRRAAPYMGAASSLVGAVAGFTLLGVWVDRKVGTQTPWFTLGGALIGMVGGFVSFFRQVLGKGTGR